MNAPVNVGELVTDDVMSSFFAPVSTDRVSSLVGRYQHARERIKDVVILVADKA